MPNRETEGLFVAFYADVSGTQTLVAAKRGLELEETTDNIDVSHATNMRAPIEVLNLDTSNDEVTIRGDRALELNAHPTFELVNTDGDDGTYEAASVSLSGGDTVITVSGDITNGGLTGTAQALIIAPYGYIQRIPGQQDWSASWDGIMLLDDATGSFEASHEALRNAKRNENSVLVQTRYPNTDGSNPRDEGDVYIETITLTAPYDAEATIAMDMVSDAPLVFKT